MPRKKTLRSLENPAVPLNSPAAYNYLAAPRSSSGITVDRRSVLAYPAVWRSLTLVSDKIGRLPLNVYKRNKSGGREIDYEHPAQWLLSRRPSELYTPFVFKKQLVFNALLHGNGYAWINRIGDRPDELILLNPEAVGLAIKGNQVTYVYRMEAQDNFQVKTILPENMIHLKGLSEDGLLGYSVINVLREALGMGMALARYGSVFFRNNGSPGPLILKFPLKLDKQAMEYMREELSKVHTGLDNSHKPMILQQGAELDRFTVDNETAQFLQTREHEIACCIANIFGIPAHKLGVPRNSSYNSLEMEERAFLLDTLDGWLVALESELEAKLLRESQLVRSSHFIEADRRSLEQADYNTRSAAMIAEVNGGIRTLNEVRSELGLPGAGEDGDKYRVPTTLTFLDKLGEQPPAVDPITGQLAPVQGDDEQGPEPLSDDPPTDDPDPPAEQGTRMRELLRNNLTRWLRRVSKSASPLASHRSVLEASVGADGRLVAGALLDALQSELDAVLPEQRDAVFERVNVDDWVEKLMSEEP